MPGRLESIELFLAVVENGGFAAAARRLARSPAAVTRAVAALESWLGARLIDRTTRSLNLTDAGRQYFSTARRLLEEFRQTEHAIARTQTAPAGTLRMTAPIVFGRLHVLPVVTAYLDDNPEVGVQLTLADQVLSLVEEGLDVAVRIGELPDSSLVARRVGEVRRVVCASRDYLKRHGRPRHPADLAGHAGVVSAGRPGAARWNFHHKGRVLTATVRPRLAVNGAEAALDAAAAGLGIARVLSYQLRPRLAAGTLVPILEGFEDRIDPVHLVAPAGRHMPATVRAFFDLAVRMLPRRLH